MATWQPGNLATWQPAVVLVCFSLLFSGCSGVDEADLSERTGELNPGTAPCDFHWEGDYCTVSSWDDFQHWEDTIDSNGDAPWRTVVVDHDEKEVFVELNPLELNDGFILVSDDPTAYEFDGEKDFADKLITFLGVPGTAAEYDIFVQQIYLPRGKIEIVGTNSANLYPAELGFELDWLSDANGEIVVGGSPYDFPIEEELGDYTPHGTLSGEDFSLNSTSSSSGTVGLSAGNWTADFSGGQRVVFGGRIWYSEINNFRVNGQGSTTVCTGILWFRECEVIGNVADYMKIVNGYHNASFGHVERVDVEEGFGVPGIRVSHYRLFTSGYRGMCAEGRVTHQLTTAYALRVISPSGSWAISCGYIANH